MKTSPQAENRLQGDTVKYISEFKLAVDSAFRMMHNVNAQKVTVKEAIGLVKIYNSIVSYDLLDQAPYKAFLQKFSTEYIKSVLEVLECKSSIGMGNYCDKYNISIGGVKYPKNSYIIILELSK